MNGGARPPDRPAGGNWPSTGQDDRNAGWVIISYLVAGMIIYGGLGWLIGHWVGAVQIATLIGIICGLILALTLVIYRYGRA
jgi:F0F1-type ATP synthase assembly protein I